MMYCRAYLNRTGLGPNGRGRHQTKANECRYREAYSCPKELVHDLSPVCGPRRLQQSASLAGIARMTFTMLTLVTVRASSVRASRTPSNPRKSLHFAPELESDELRGRQVGQLRLPDCAIPPEWNPNDA